MKNTILVTKINTNTDRITKQFINITLEDITDYCNKYDISYFTDFNFFNKPTKVTLLI